MAGAGMYRGYPEKKHSKNRVDTIIETLKYSGSTGAHGMGLTMEELIDTVKNPVIFKPDAAGVPEVDSEVRDGLKVLYPFLRKY